MRNTITLTSSIFLLGSREQYLMICVITGAVRRTRPKDQRLDFHYNFQRNESLKYESVPATFQILQQDVFCVFSMKTGSNWTACEFYSSRGFQNTPCQRSQIYYSVCLLKYHHKFTLLPPFPPPVLYPKPSFLRKMPKLNTREGNRK